MNEEYTKRLNEDYPTFFDMDGDIRNTLMPFGFSCGSGWYHMIDDLCRTLQTWFEVHEPGWLEEKAKYPFKVVQVKEKFAGLRFYTNAVPSNDVFDIIQVYESLSYRVCEECGAHGYDRTGPWLRTLCDNCAAKAKQEARGLYVPPEPVKSAIEEQERETVAKYVKLMEALCEEAQEETQA